MPKLTQLEKLPRFPRAPSLNNVEEEIFYCWISAGYKDEFFKELLDQYMSKKDSAIYRYAFNLVKYIYEKNITGVFKHSSTHLVTLFKEFDSLKEQENADFIMKALKHYGFID